MPRILLTNDDGIFAQGLNQLAEGLAELGDLFVVAPDREQSATSHSLTLHRPLRMREVRENWYSVDGTPTDCVNLAILSLLKDEAPDLVISGINHGLNLGDDVTYSGTVSATFEASLLGIPALAFSQQVEDGFSFAPGVEFACRLAAELLAGPVEKGLLLNVNFPSTEPQGVSLARLGHRVYEQSIVEKVDPRGRKYFWIAGTPVWQEDEGTDHDAVSNGRISITPLKLDFTDYAALENHSPALDRVRRLTAGSED